MDRQDNETAVRQWLQTTSRENVGTYREFSRQMDDQAGVVAAVAELRRRLVFGEPAAASQGAEEETEEDWREEHDARARWEGHDRPFLVGDTIQLPISKRFGVVTGTDHRRFLARVKVYDPDNIRPATPDVIEVYTKDLARVDPASPDFVRARKQYENALAKREAEEQAKRQGDLPGIGDIGRMFTTPGGKRVVLCSINDGLLNIAVLCRDVRTGFMTWENPYSLRREPVEAEKED